MSCSAGTGVAVIVTDAELRILHTVGDVFEAHGDQPDARAGTRVDQILPADAWTQLEPHYRAALRGEPRSLEYRTPDGAAAYLVQISPRTDQGTVQSVVTVLHDVASELRTTIELGRSETRLRDSERLIGGGSWELALPDHTIAYSPGFARVWGIAADRALALEDCLAMTHPDDRDAFAGVIAECLRSGAASRDCRITRPDGSVRTLAVNAEAVVGDDGSPDCLIGAVLDVTDAREAESQRLAAMALWQQGFDAAPIGMVLTSPDDGRYIRANDAMCRMLGRSREELLQLTIAEVTHPDDRASLDQALAALREGRASGHEAEKRYLRPDGSLLWTTLHVAPVRNPDGSLRAFFSQVVDINDRKQQEARLGCYVKDAVWLGRIRDALDDDRLLLYSQPILDLRTGQTVQRELLLRMRDEAGCIIAPGEFLPAAERYGLISEVDRWVIRQAVRLAADGTRTEFNLSSASVGDPDVLRELGTAIEASGIDPSLLVIEVTETALIEHPDVGRRFAKQVTELGCGIALDDFGTGFASLSYLKHIPAEHLKIDIEFVRHLTSNEDDQRLVRGIVGFAREFRQTTTAEGIEDEATLAMLRELGVDRGQGYLFGRPSPLVAAPERAQAPSAASPGCSDPISIVRGAFTAFARRELDAIRPYCHPEIVLRPYVTAQLARHDAAYRGHEGLEAYLEDVKSIWEELALTPTAFWNTDGGVIAFGHVLGRVGGETRTTDVLWVCRLRDGLLATVDVFQHPTDGPPPSGTHFR
jgi:PAS domain S-box-containing protein